MQYINAVDSVEYIELLQYNSTGLAKKKALGINTQNHFHPPTQEQMKKLQSIVAENFHLIV